jgi:hypothetical protein
LIESASGAFSNGAGPAFFVGHTSQTTNGRRRGLVRFDVASALPPGAIVTAVELRLELTQSTHPEPIEIGLHRVLTAWGEGASVASGGGGAPSTPGDATWIHTEYPDAFWDDPGGDFVAAQSSVQVVAGAGLVTWPSTPGVVADVQAWLDDASGNHGWLLLGGEEARETSKRFASREAEEPEAPPRLVVEYVPPCSQQNLDGASRALCHVYCEALDCDAPAPAASPRACAELARQFDRRSGGGALVCEPHPVAPLSHDGLLVRHGVESPLRPHHERNPSWRADLPPASSSSTFPCATSSAPSPSSRSSASRSIRSSPTSTRPA